MIYKHLVSILDSFRSKSILISSDFNMQFLHCLPSSLLFFPSISIYTSSTSLLAHSLTLSLSFLPLLPLSHSFFFYIYFACNYYYPLFTFSRGPLLPLWLHAFLSRLSRNHYTLLDSLFTFRFQPSIPDLGSLWFQAFLVKSHISVVRILIYKKILYSDIQTLSIYCR